MRLICQQHGEPVDADPETTGRWHPVFESEEIVLVDRMRLVVALGAGRRLRLEASALVEWLVELGEGVAVLGACDEQLPALRQVLVLAVAPGQW